MKEGLDFKIARIRSDIAQFNHFVSVLESAPDTLAVTVQFFPEQIFQAFVVWIAAGVLLPIIRLCLWVLKKHLSILEQQKQG